MKLRPGKQCLRDILFTKKKTKKNSLTDLLSNHDILLNIVNWRKWLSLHAQSFFPLVPASSIFCARHVMHRARALSRIKLKIIWIIGKTDSGRWPLIQLCVPLLQLCVDLKTDFIYNDLHIVQKWTKTGRGKLISRFQSTGYRILPSCDCKVRETMVDREIRTCSLRNLTSWLNSFKR